MRNTTIFQDVRTYVLKDKSGREVDAGAELLDFRGERCLLLRGTPPKHEASSGRVMLQYGAGPGGGEYFPSVVGLKWEAA